MKGGEIMAVARVTEVVASSAKNWDDAVAVALKRANKTLRNITGIEVVSYKGKVENGKVSEYRVSLRITFILED
jgi:flavin-binding protein dodecin